MSSYTTLEEHVRFSAEKLAKNNVFDSPNMFCDVYCLESGSVIAEGDPEEVRTDPLVIASYLGTDIRAIDRSDG